MSFSSIKLTSEDYYRYNSPFRQWLFDFKDSQLNDYKTDRAREIFSNEFVPLWNNFKLSKEFYEKGPNMKTNFIKTEKEKSPSETFGFSKQEKSRLFSHTPLQKSSQLIPVSSQSIQGSKIFDKSFQKRRIEDLDELLVKKEGKAKIVEDRRIKSAYTRMERNPFDLDISDDQLLSGSISSNPASQDYSTLLRLEREKRERKEREVQMKRDEKERALQNKIDKHNKRENEVREILKKMMNNKNK